MFTAEVFRFKPDTGKYYDTIEFVFEKDSFLDACAEISDHQLSREKNPSQFIYVISGVGTLKHIHPKLFKS